MLSPNDIHYLVGLLTRITEPGNVDIELGSMIFDVAADKKRDVDVTIIYKDANGTPVSLRGIEVKDHSKPLDAGHVDGLCQKLNDMPDIKIKGIVSASGYTRAAKNKAKYHGVELFHLADWENTMEGFEHVKFSTQFNFKQISNGWREIKGVMFITSPQETLTEKISFNTAIFSSSGKSIPNVVTLKDLLDRIAPIAVRDYFDKRISETPPVSSFEEEVIIPVFLTDRPQIETTAGLVTLESLKISGTVFCQLTEEPIIPKVLIKDGEAKPYVGCLIGNLSNGSLIGFVVDQVNHSLRMINIPVAERLKNKIYKVKL